MKFREIKGQKELEELLIIEKLDEFTYLVKNKITLAIICKIYYRKGIDRKTQIDIYPLNPTGVKGGEYRNNTIGIYCVGLLKGRELMFKVGNKNRNLI
jgi:hypothetical protein